MARRVRDLMRRDFIHLSGAEDVDSVHRLMAMARVRELPVVEGGRLAGLVCQRDLARAVLRRALGRASAAPPGPIAPYVRPVEPVSSEATIPEAAHRMLRARTACLPTVEGEPGEPRVVGLLTESALLREAYGAAAAPRSR